MIVEWLQSWLVEVYEVSYKLYQHPVQIQKQKNTVPALYWQGFTIKKPQQPSSSHHESRKKKTTTSSSIKTSPNAAVWYDGPDQFYI